MVKIKYRLALFALMITGFFAVFILTAASDSQPFTVSIITNPSLDASFVKKEKTKDRGWRIYIKFTNKTDDPIRSIGTKYELREGDWKILSNWKQQSSNPAMLAPGQSATFDWIDEVPSSVNHIHFTRVDVK